MNRFNTILVLLFNLFSFNCYSQETSFGDIFKNIKNVHLYEGELNYSYLASYVNNSQTIFLQYIIKNDSVNANEFSKMSYHGDSQLFWGLLIESVDNDTSIFIYEETSNTCLLLTFASCESEGKEIRFVFSVDSNNNLNYIITYQNDKVVNLDIILENSKSYVRYFSIKDTNMIKTFDIQYNTSVKTYIERLNSLILNLQIDNSELLEMPVINYHLKRMSERFKW